MIQRILPTPDELRAELSKNPIDPDALASFDEWRLATAPPAFVKVMIGAGGDGESAPYDVARAKAWFKNKKLPPEKFAKMRQANEKIQTDSAVADVKSVTDACNETDGTNRPHAAGNPPAVHGPGSGTRPAGVTSEGALMWEARYGQPWMTLEGHYKKVRDYIDGLSKAITRLESYIIYVRDAGLLVQIDDAIRRAKNRVGAMRAPLSLWNNRASVYPAIWEPSGKPKVVAVAIDTGTPIPEWPANPGLMVV